MPVAAFKTGGEAWVVLPSAPAARCYAQLGERPERHGGRPGAHCPLGKAELFDVKPLWAHSNQRAGFFRTIANFDFRPSRPQAQQKSKHQWEKVFETLSA